MVIGSLRINNWQIKSEVLTVFNLGKGHINWLKSRLLYLFRRHEAVKVEMRNRGFKCDVLIIDKVPAAVHYWNDWQPTLEDSIKIRNRLVEKIRFNKLPISWWRYKRVNLNLESVEAFLDRIVNGELYYV